MRKNIIPRESAYWRFMKMREVLMRFREALDTSKEKRLLDKIAFTCRLMAIHSRKKEVRDGMGRQAAPN